MRAKAANESCHASSYVHLDAVHQLEAHEELLARLDVELGRNEHAVRREIERSLADELEIALAHDLALDLNRATNGATLLQVNEIHAASEMRMTVAA